MKPDVHQVNAALRQLTDDYAGGKVSAAAYRGRRRELVCGVTGQALPELDDGEATCPGLPVVSVKPTVDPAPGGEAIIPADEQSATARTYRAITLAVLVLAIAGAVGLLWFVFRK